MQLRQFTHAGPKGCLLERVELASLKFKVARKKVESVSNTSLERSHIYIYISILGWANLSNLAQWPMLQEVDLGHGDEGQAL